MIEDRTAAEEHKRCRNRSEEAGKKGKLKKKARRKERTNSKTEKINREKERGRVQMEKREETFTLFPYFFFPFLFSSSF